LRLDSEDFIRVGGYLFKLISISRGDQSRFTVGQFKGDGTVLEQFSFYTDEPLKLADVWFVVVDIDSSLVALREV
jgi:hypothetical protein